MTQLISDEQWEQIAVLFPKPKSTGRPRRNPRQVLEGILWVLLTGVPWRDIPKRFGSWKTCWRMYHQWNADGTLDKVLSHLEIVSLWHNRQNLTQSIEDPSDSTERENKKHDAKE